MRLGLALLLALGCHIFFLLLILPEQQDHQPEIRGEKQVRVSIVRQESSPVQNFPEVVQDEVPEPEVVPGPVEMVEEEVVVVPVRKPSPKLESVTRKQAVPEKKPVHKAKPVVDTARKVDRVKPVQLLQEGSGVEQTEAEIIGKAVPLVEKNLPPEYPGLARRRGWEGTVLLEVDVEPDGQVKTVRIQTSSSYSLLDNAALDAVQKWQFMPGTRNGRPAAMKVLVPVHFVLKEEL